MLQYLGLLDRELWVLALVTWVLDQVWYKRKAISFKLFNSYNFRISSLWLIKYALKTRWKVILYDQLL